MKRLFYNVLVDIKVLFRVPLSIFFSTVFPVLLMVILLLAYGDQALGNGMYLSDKYLLICTGMGIAPLSLISLPMSIGGSADRNYLRRLSYFGISIKQILASNIIAHFVVGLLSAITTITFAVIFYQASLPSLEYFLVYLSQIILALVGMLTLGAVIGFGIRDTNIIMPLGLLLTFICYMLTGGFVDYSELPETVKMISNGFILKYVTIDSFSTWEGSSYYPEKFFQVFFLQIGIGITLLTLAVNRWIKKYK